MDKKLNTIPMKVWEMLWAVEGKEEVNKLFPLDRPVYYMRGGTWGTIAGWFGQWAITMNGIVYLTKWCPEADTDAVTETIAHETQHVLDQRRAGWIPFLIAYVVLWRPSHMTEGRTHPLERMAYVTGDKVASLLARFEEGL